MRLAPLLLALTLAAGAASARDELPNPRLTPGAVRQELTREAICSTKWGRDARHVTAKMKRETFAAYGMRGNDDPRCVADARGRRCEIDHLISRELGGADDVRNLWPQPFGTRPWNARLKDKLENRLHRELCVGNITLKQAQGALVNDWRAAYRRYYGEPKP